MANVTIQIIDKPDGSVSIKFDPPMKDLMNANEDLFTAAHCYAASAANAFMEVSRKMKTEQAKDPKAPPKIWMPQIIK